MPSCLRHWSPQEPKAPFSSDIEPQSSQHWFAFLFAPKAWCHKKGVAHHGEQIGRHANSSLRDAYFSTEPHVRHVLAISLLHVCLVWTWVGHREGLTGLFAGLVGSSGLKRVSWNVLGLRAPQRGLVGCSGLERVSFKTGA
jgi:hypothetical protein